MWGRHYIFYHQGMPLTVIYEAFSNSLEEYLGPRLPGRICR
jgi:chorismate--pyruvate lyase